MLDKKTTAVVTAIQLFDIQDVFVEENLEDKASRGQIISTSMIKSLLKKKKEMRSPNCFSSLKELENATMYYSSFS